MNEYTSRAARKRDALLGGQADFVGVDVSFPPREAEFEDVVQDRGLQPVV